MFNVKHWLRNAAQGVILDEESQFINKNGDLIPVVSKTKSPLHNFIDRSKSYPLSALFRDRSVHSPVISITYILDSDFYQMNCRLHGSSGDFGIDTTV